MRADDLVCPRGMRKEKEILRDIIIESAKFLIGVDTLYLLLDRLITLSKLNKVKRLYWSRVTDLGIFEARRYLLLEKENIAFIGSGSFSLVPRMQALVHEDRCLHWKRVKLVSVELI